MSAPEWPAQLTPLPPGTIITTRAAIARYRADGVLALELLRALVAADAIHLADDGLWRINPAVGRPSVTGMGGETHEMLDRLKEAPPEWAISRTS